MKLVINPTELSLVPKQQVKVRAAAGHTLVCHRGQVWLTQHHDTRDVILQAGEAFALDRDGLALVQAFEPSLISIMQTARSPRAAGPVAGLEPAAALGLWR